ncbi:MAG: hypothetical protein E7264_08080 [Lachnospiraceae bacterium]|nr:hypothetical protein [Lachnospiraceae bacterium]
MKIFKKVVAFLFVGALVLGMAPATAYAKDFDMLHVDMDPEQYKGVKIEDEGNGVSTEQFRGAFPAKYDPRLTGKVSKIVEDQGGHSNCWAFAAVAAMEANIIKKGYENNSLNLSENHLTYFFYNRTTDPVGYTKGDYNTPRGFWADNGGTIEGTALTLATWSGTVKQTTSEDDANGQYLPQGLDDTLCYRSDYRVASTYFYDYDVNTVKQAIMNHGAVAIGFYMDQVCYWSDDKKSYYSPVPQSPHSHAGGHAVTIVGWDDNYSKYNFSYGYQPSNNGAWIVKNSYGPNISDGGYIYISYEDKSISQLAAYDMVRVADSYDRNYQYDGSGALGFYYYEASGTSFANVYRVKSGTYNEVLKAIAANVFSKNVKYTVDIYTGVTGSSPTSGKLAHRQTGTITQAGYNQIKLTKPVTLAAGEKYAVVVKLASPNGSDIKMSCDVSVNAGWIQFTNSVEPGQSYIKRGKKWYDTGKSSGAGRIPIYADANGYPTPVGYAYSNSRIKAYTDVTTQKTTYKLSSKKMGVSKGSTAKLSLLINPSAVQRKVTWSSSNKKIATVSSTGKIKGKSYGTVTIKGKFAAGKKTKTLTCKVTVGPAKIKNFKAKGAKKKVTLTWKKSSGASGYEVCYGKSSNGSFKKLTTVKSGSKTKVTAKIKKKGTYYVKMRPYVKKGGKTLYGSYTSAKKVTVK